MIYTWRRHTPSIQCAPALPGIPARCALCKPWSGARPHLRVDPVDDRGPHPPLIVPELGIQTTGEQLCHSGLRLGQNVDTMRARQYTVVCNRYMSWRLTLCGGCFCAPEPHGCNHSWRGANAWSSHHVGVVKQRHVMCLAAKLISIRAQNKFVFLVESRLRVAIQSRKVTRV